MKKYLIRTGCNPAKDYKFGECIRHDYIGGNTGNMLYSYGIMNTLTTGEDVEFDITGYKMFWSKREAQQINEKYDAVIFPLADAFRSSFINELHGFTELVKQLTIPCYVIGCGIRAPYEPNFSGKRDYDGAAKEFISEILNHSACVGVRGEITGKYLETIGFSQNDYRVIGCPSLYTYGDTLPDVSYNGEKGSVAFAVNPSAPQNVKDLVYEYTLSFDKRCMVHQSTKELADVYAGKNIKNKYRSNNMSPEHLESLFRRDEAQFFLNPRHWTEYLSQYDLFIGNRFHGNVAAILAGIPSVTIAADGRMRELIAHHHLTSIPQQDLHETVNLDEIIAGLDFGSFKKNQRNNIDSYADFLRDNEIENVFDAKNERDYAIPKGESVMEKEDVFICRPEITCGESLSCVGLFGRKINYSFSSGVKKVDTLSKLLKAKKYMK